MTNKKIKQIISKLSNFELDIRNVPNDVKNNKKIIEAERQLGIRITKNRGFDVIRQIFFVEEDICYKNGMGEFRSVDNYVMFDTFETYYDYLDGDIYDLACYSFLDYKKYEHFIEIKNIDVSKMKERKTFLSKNIDDEVIEVEKYKQVIEENGMYLLQNELLYKKADNRLYKISYNELMSKTIEEIRKQIESTRLVILGGIGFSGYNKGQSFFSWD